MIVENYLKMLNERRSKVSNNEILYHGSKVQNLKVIDPEKWVDALLVEHVATIWTSWDKGFAAMFCIDWRKNMDEIQITSDIVYYMSLPEGRDPRWCESSDLLPGSPMWKDPAWKDPRRKGEPPETPEMYGIKPDTPRCKKMRENPSWMVVIPRSYRKLLMKPCSLYLVKGKNWVVPQVRHQIYPWEWPEAYSKEPAQVIKEIKYSNVIEAYKKNGVKLLIEDLPIYRKKWWNRIFSKLKQ
jgi:hypothetical protein